MTPSTVSRLRRARFAAPLLCAWAVLACSTGCQYDLEPLEEAIAARGDAAADAGGDGAAAVPEQLIDLFEEAPFFSDQCRRCAVNNCSEANEACHTDPECEAVTACLAQAHNPRNQAQCREEHREWFEKHATDIDIGGAFYDCVMWRACVSQCGAADDLACVGEYSWPATANGAQIPLTLVLQEARTLEPAAGALAKVCLIEDLACTHPSMTDTANKQGRVELMLPAPQGEFTGYIELTGAKLAPTLLVFGWPMTTGDARRMPVVSAATVALQQIAGGVPTVANTGLVQARVFGCGGSGTRNVNVSVRPRLPETDTWYYDGQLPDFEVDVTYDNGNAGVINVPPGLVNVTGTRQPENDVVLRWTVPVRVDHLTILIGAPSER